MFSKDLMILNNNLDFNYVIYVFRVQGSTNALDSRP
jgi:hypothetical protein